MLLAVYMQSTILRSWAMSPLVGICHELALSTALAEWVLRDDALPRSEGSLIEANRCMDLVGLFQNLATPISFLR